MNPEDKDPEDYGQHALRDLFLGTIAFILFILLWSLLWKCLR